MEYLARDAQQQASQQGAGTEVKRFGLVGTHAVQYKWFLRGVQGRADTLPAKPAVCG
jgi:hypothetical protein